MADTGFYIKNAGRQSSFTDGMKRHLKDNYHVMSVKDLAEHYGLKESQVTSQANRQHLVKRVKRT